VPADRNETWRWLLLGAAALVFRLGGAFLRPPWHDEYFTAWAASLPWHDLLAALRVDSGPPLLYALVKLLVAAGMSPLVAARGVPVMAGTAAVLLGAVAARRAFGAAAGWWTGALLAVHPLAVAWSCEGRAYALLLAAAAWGWERLERLADRERGAIGLALAVALACWSHAFGLVLAGALALAALTLRGQQRRIALSAVAAGLASHLPWLPVALAQPPAATAWMREAWQALPTAEQALAPVRLLATVAPFGNHTNLPSVPLAAQIVAGIMCLVLLLASASSPRGWLLLLPPAAGLTGLTFLGLPAFYGGRGEALFLVPFLALLASAAVKTRALRMVAALLVAGGATVSAVALRDWQQRPPSGEARLAAAIRQASPTGGTIVIGGYWRLGLWYHLGESRDRFTLVNFPAEAAAHPGWYGPTLDRPAPAELRELSALLTTKAPRTTIVLNPSLPTARDLGELAHDLGLRRALAVPGAELFLPGGSATSP
jgi:hypothetical protein